MAIYEADGTRVPPKAVEELEYLCEIGGTFDETSVTLSVYSTSLDREYVSQLLGVQPTCAWNPHERHPFGKQGRTRILDYGKWYLSSACDTSPVEQKIVSLLAQCADNLEAWRQLAQEYEVWLTICGHLDNWNRELDLSVDMLQLLVERNLTLKVDVYFDGDEEEVEEESPLE